MKMPKKIVVTIALTLALFVPSALALTDQQVKQIVKQDFPSSLVDDFTQANPDATYTYTTADFNGDGTNIIAAAYTNGETIQLRMIGSDGTVLDTGAGLPKFKGDYIKLETHDFDGDGHPELVLSTFGGAVMSSPTFNWIFKWTGSNLQLISPTVTAYGFTGSKFHDAAFEDLDLDGKTEVITDGPQNMASQNSTTTGVTYEWQGNKFVEASDLVFFKGFNSFSGTPWVINEQFAAPDPNITYRLIIFNGVDGQRLATSATLSLNGNVIIGNGEFDQTVPSVEKTIALQSANVLTGQFQGNPSGFIEVNIERLLPIAPSDLTARAKSGEIQLVWTHTGADSYNIYRSQTQGGPYTSIANTTSTYSTYLDTGLTNGTTYYYVVSAVAGGAESSQRSNEVSATPDVPVLRGPKR